MATGKTLEMIDFSRTMRLLQKANATVSQGNLDHYHAKGRAAGPHKVFASAAMDRPRYRAQRRRERLEAELLKAAQRAREADRGSGVMDEISGP